MYLEDEELSRIVGRVCQENPSLEELDLAGNYWGNMSLHVVATCLQRNKNLRDLYMGDPVVDDDNLDMRYERDFSILAEAVKKGTQLKNVTINFNLPTTHLEDLLSSVLLRCPTIEELRIYTSGATRISSKEIEDMEGLVRDVRATSSLRYMSFDSTPLSDAEPLFRILSHCPKLEDLCLRDAAIKQLDVLTPFAKPSPCRLRRLCLYNNPFADRLHLGFEEVEKVISSVLQANPMLGNLDISPYPLPDGMRHLQDMNWAGRVLLGTENTPQPLWATVIERVHDNEDWEEDRKASVLFDLLRGGSDFLIFN